MRPGTDTALMVGMAHVLVREGLHDRDFLAHYCEGWPTFEDYLLGKIQISSPAIAAFGYADCPDHPCWLLPTEAPGGAHPLILLANQPATRRYSQLDFGAHSASAKRQGREICRLHPADAAARNIADGDIVRLFNARGACLASARVTDDDLMQGVMQLPTGAWYDPQDSSERPLCVHGNPNVLTRDIGTSSLAQGCSGQLSVVEVERIEGALPPLRADQPPVVAQPAKAV